TLHPGPRHELNLWTRTAGPAQGIFFGDRFLEIGLWRLGDVDGKHFVISQVGGQTAQTYRSDNRLFPGPNGHWTGVLDRYAEYHCGSIHAAFGTCTGLATGDRFIQLGDWRLADIDGDHFSISCKTGQTSQVFHRSGTVLPGPRSDFGAWKRETRGLEYPGVALGDRFLQIGQWRLWAEGTQLSLSHQTGATVKVYQSDGSSAGSLPAATAALARLATGTGIGFGDRFLQVGHFRLGDVDGTHFAISHDGGLSEVHHSDGTVLPPGSTMTTLGRRLEECELL
ncbi:Ank3, partial [Symbiodinium natans]